ncbi:MAG: hypothetical protein J6C98_09880 [Oscillospiraceae bacterium]|nr:hypothetical protein [Oscillospiraceae bacterium]
MYCINCGVKLADSEKRCPLCAVTVFHPELDRPEGEALYPPHHNPAPQVSSRGLQIVLTTAFLLPLLITLLCDLQINGLVTWSGYVVGALIVGYVALVLPIWFRRPNPVIFVPCFFVAVGLYLLYINLATGGSWFMSFAFPVVGGIGLILTAVVALLRYVRRGKLYIIGGAAAALGAFMPLTEYLIYITFQRPRFVGWSLYPLTALVLLGGMLIFLAIHRPARETMERKFFI